MGVVVSCILGTISVIALSLLCLIETIVGCLVLVLKLAFACLECVIVGTGLGLFAAAQGLAYVLTGGCLRKRKGRKSESDAGHSLQVVKVSPTQ
ncbi:hypothetical protein GYMLUDRAFT_48450 [Collybiopsis luxurians FD-317 M1]|uniref:Unplaced genomic scaffold GYMLUscaffold_65, whole genome shotgun sequence n=1 Tax=Collybiopsis luxurians FD-317 M1 TaxID=944289 RepID=A0A0D0CIC8_9AGAR|nr:hypothetical protein GYMLUDRAFT_48450 [Collybiopsis luxurians FD-317 M1]